MRPSPILFTAHWVLRLAGLLTITGLIYKMTLEWNSSFTCGRVAQSAEQGTHKPLVVGSNPTPATSF